MTTELPLRPRALAVALALAFLTPAQASDWRDKASPQLLEQAKSGAPLDVLLVLRGDPGLALIDPRQARAARGAAVATHLQQLAASSQAGVRAELDARGIDYQTLWIANAIATRLDAAALAAIGARDEVLRIHSDRSFKVELPVAEPLQPKAAKAIAANVTRVRAPEAWALGFRGQGVVVGAQDTGYQWDHPAVKNRYRGWDGTLAIHAYQWHDAIHSLLGSGSNPCGLNAVAPCDDNGHGTHTIGTVLGDDGAANQIGVAPDARWIACRNMERGNGRPSTYIECFQFFLAPTDAAGLNPDPGLAPDIVTNSWGCPVGPPPSGEDCALDSFDATLEAMHAAGILVVVAAGNGSPSCGSINSPPAISPRAFTVGSTTNADVLSSFSLIGPVTVDGSNRLKPDVVAPGSGVRSAQPGGGYVNLSGTSMATPNVAGVAALVMSANPALRGDPDAVAAILRESALPLNPAGLNCGSFVATAYPNHIYGYGRVDALNAVQRAEAQAALFVDGFEVAGGR
jgi:subtilisin family serine protease